MTSRSLYRSTGISIAAFSSIISGSGNLPKSLVYDDLANRAISYQHEIRSMPGFYEARIGMFGNDDFITDWMTRGLGRHIEVYNPYQQIIFEGFVNSAQLQIGSSTLTFGPLTDIGNRAILVFSSLAGQTGGVNPIVGVREATDPAVNEDSQELYGIFHKILSTAGVTIENAEILRDLWIAENAFPRINKQISTNSESSEPRFSINVVGYWKMLQYVYENFVIAGSTVNASSKILDLISGEPNGLFAVPQDNIETNTLQVDPREVDYRTAWTLIKSLVDAGDGFSIPFLFSVGAGRRVNYGQVPTELKYSYKLKETSQDIRLFKTDTIVEPWDVKPGEWIQYPDIVPGVVDSVVTGVGDFNNLNSNIFNEFITTVRYQSPRKIDMPGTKFSSLKAQLTRLGLSGIGVT